MASLNIIENEKINIKIIFDNPSLLSIVYNKNYFISTLARSLFDSLLILYRKGMDFSNNNVIIESKNDRINHDLINELKQIVYTADKIDYYIDTLKKEWSKKQIQEKIIKNITEEVTSKDTLNLEKIQELRNELNSCIALIDGTSEKLLLKPEDIIEDFSQSLADRQRYLTGSSILDTIIPKGFEPGYITTVFAEPGMGKSAFVLNLINGHINRSIPSILVSLEMHKYTQIERLISLRQGIKPNNFYPNESNEIDNAIIDILNIEKRRLSKERFRLVEKPDLYLKDIENLILKYQDEIKQEYMIVTIDLFTMIKDTKGNNNKAVLISDALDLQHEIAKRTNVHFINVVQKKRASQKINLKSIEDIKKLRPSIEEIKESSTFHERSRIILGLFRPLHVAKIYLPNDPRIEIMDDILECILLKYNMGETGKIVEYFYDAEIYRISKYEHTEE